MSNINKNFRYSPAIHTCQYPNCNQQFDLYHDLLNHQRIHPKPSGEEISAQGDDIENFNQNEIVEAEEIGNAVNSFFHIMLKY